MNGSPSPFHGISSHNVPSLPYIYIYEYITPIHTNSLAPCLHLPLSIDCCATAVHEAKAVLLAAGFTELKEKEEWATEPNGKVYTLQQGHRRELT